MSDNAENLNSLALPPIKVVLCWHMHQPQYRDLLSGKYYLPWTYLHAIKDYIDMVAHLESNKNARCVVNFAPILLEQIIEYAAQTKQFLESGSAIRDRILANLVSTVLPTSVEQRSVLIRHCLRVNKERSIDRFPAYKRLFDIASVFNSHPESLLYMDDQFLVDIIVWYHLAWLGETVRRQDQRIIELVKKEHGYTLHDRHTLLEVINELLNGLLTRYKTLANTGQIELSLSPYAHPIIPLLLDFNSAKQAMPDTQLPEMSHYPGGEERARWHIKKGLELFKQVFDYIPNGCWPSEGGVCNQTLKLLNETGFKWTASGENVFRNSINACKQKTQKNNSLYHPQQLFEQDIVTFFRDDGLSDLIGFTYSNWHADDAVANLIHHIENIAKAQQDSPNSIVSIIMDGENAWEHYPENGYYFLSALYAQLNKHPQIELTTFSDCLINKVKIDELPKLVSGSWVYGTFSTWIGSADKNKGWDMLESAKKVFDKVVSTDQLSEKRLELAQKQLAICEGSDWFWWFGDYNPEDSVSDFEHLFRQQLTNLYQILGEEPPDTLSHVFTHGRGMPQGGGVMRPGSQH